MPVSVEDKNRSSSMPISGPVLRRTLWREWRGSLLVFSCETEDEWAALPREEQPALILENRDFIFEGEQKALCQKTYSAQAPACAGDLLVSVTAPEMAEVFIGGQCLGAAFWPPQEIRISKEHLPKGPFTLRLVLTGSRANQYGRPVPYGLGET